MTDPGYDRNKFEFWSPEGRLINRDIHEFLYFLNRLLQPKVDHLLTTLTTPLTETEQYELQGLNPSDSEDDDDDDELASIPTDPVSNAHHDQTQADIETANKTQADADSNTGESP